MIPGQLTGPVAANRLPPAAPAAISYLQGAQDITTQTTYTYSSQNLGAADAARHIIVVGHVRASGATALSVSSVTVAGVSASVVVERLHAATNACHSFIAIAAVPTGTSGNVVVTYSRSGVRGSVYLYRAIGLVSATATDTDSVASNVPANHSIGLNISAGGVAIGGIERNDGGACTWTGLTEDYDASFGSGQVSGAHDAFASAQTNRTIAAQWSGGTFGEGSSVYASFR